MTAELWAAVGGVIVAVTGLLSLMFKVRIDKYRAEADDLKMKVEADRAKGDLAVALTGTAQTWLDYIDGKFDQVNEELTCYKAAQANRDAAIAVLLMAHREWDRDVMARLAILGETVSDPPPLDLPYDFGEVMHPS